MKGWPAYDQSWEGQPTLAEVVPKLAPYFVLQSWCPFSELTSIVVVAEVVVWDTNLGGFTLLLLDLTGKDGQSRRCCWAGAAHPIPDPRTGHDWVIPPVDLQPGVVALEWHQFAPSSRRLYQVEAVYDALFVSPFRGLIPLMLEFEPTTSSKFPGGQEWRYEPGLGGDYDTSVWVKPEGQLRRLIWPETLPTTEDSKPIDLNLLSFSSGSSPYPDLTLRFHRFPERRPVAAWAELPLERPQVFAALTLEIGEESYLLVTAEMSSPQP